MANVSVYNMEGKQIDTIELNDAVFGVEVNEHLVHMAVVQQLANNRQGTQKAKTRSEVSGGGRKPWRQKGTGHARQVMKNLDVNNGLVVVNENDVNVMMSAKNIADVKMALPNTINVYDIMKAGKVVLTKDAVKTIEEVYA